MNQGWRKRLKELIEGTPGLDMRTLSRKAGLNPGYISEMYAKPSTPTVDAFLKIAQAAGVSPTWLLTGEEDSPVEIPLAGTIGGETWTPLDKKRVTPQLRDFDLIAFNVEGNGMAPSYRAGDLLICQRHAGRSISNLIGQDYVVQTVGGERYLKILKRGARAGTYDLRSFHASEPDIEAVALEWAAPVVWIKRGGGR